MINLEKFLLEQVLPRSVYIPYLIVLPIVWIVQTFSQLNRLFKNRYSDKSLLCIEAGVRGWDIIEYKELYESAIEYLGEKLRGVDLSGYAPG